MAEGLTDYRWALQPFQGDLSHHQASHREAYEASLGDELAAVRVGGRRARIKHWRQDDGGAHVLQGYPFGEIDTARSFQDVSDAALVSGSTVGTTCSKDLKAKPV